MRSTLRRRHPCVVTVAALLIAAAGAARVSPQTTTARVTAIRPQAPSTPAAVAAILDSRIGAHPGAGIVVGLIDASGRRTIVTAGRAGASNGRPLDGGTVFEIGSITKVFTALLLAEMVQRGDVRLDDPVASLIPAARIPSRGGRQITLQSLTMHTSGLPRMPANFAPADVNNPYADYTAERLYAFLAGFQPTRDVGERYEYSNLGAGLLGHALASKAGKTYEEALVERVLGPLCLNDTRVTPSAPMRERVAVGHSATGDETSNWDFTALAGAGALRSTVNDMLSFLAANLRPPSGVLGRAIELMQAVRQETTVPPGHVALGWHVRPGKDVEVTWHNGGTGGFHAFVAFERGRGTAVAVLHNSSTNIDDIGFHLIDPQFPLAATDPLPVPRAVLALAPSALDAFVGEYALTPAFHLTVTRQGPQLFVQATGQPKSPVFAESAERFFWKAVDAQITFVKDGSGRVIEAILHQNGVDQRAARQ